MSLKRGEVGEKSRMAAGGGGAIRCCCRLPPSSLALKKGPRLGVDAEVCYR